MGDAGVFFIIVLFAVVAIAIRLMAGGLDHDRVRAYVQSRGGRLLEANWAPFGKGWFGEKSDRIYEIRYADADGNEHRASCKTSLFSGVYFTDDRIIRYATSQADEQAENESGHTTDGDLQMLALEDENRRLREQVERLKRAQG
jgi:hypothetical protein